MNIDAWLEHIRCAHATEQVDDAGARGAQALGGERRRDHHHRDDRSIVWFVLFIVQVPFYGWYADHGHEWWIWTCLAGAGLGLIGLRYVRARRDALRRAAASETREGRPQD